MSAISHKKLFRQHKSSKDIHASKTSFGSCHCEPSADTLFTNMKNLRTIINRSQVYMKRCYATGPKLVEVTRDSDTGIDILSMSRAPVNSLNIQLLDSLKTSLLEAKNSHSKGIILTSSLPTVFSAGLDLVEFYNKDKNQLVNYWQTLQDTWLTLYTMDIPTAAAINGSSPAGGCLLAISTEYRVFVQGKHSIGLNETHLGLMAPKWFREIYVLLLGYQQAELALLKGTLFTPEKALKIGLVHELANDKDDAIEKCKNYISSFENIPQYSRALTKSEMRKDLIDWFNNNKKADTEVFVNLVQMPKIQASLKLYLQFLKQKKQ